MSDKGNKNKERISNLKGDYGNIAFLLLLYVLQGIPIGFSSAVPLLLQNKNVSYSDQALFSFVTWPFSTKLLWAPIVDSIYWRWLGRRKSWLVPVQFGIGIFMLILSFSVNSLLINDPISGKKPDIYLLTLIFLMLNFLAATQDIAVDGWALTMLKRRNVGYASTCNTVGQTAGFFFGNVIFLALESAKFCNKYLRSARNQSDEGIVTFESFLYQNGIMFLVVTTLVAILKTEKNPTKDNNMVLEVKTTQRMVTRRLASETKSLTASKRKDSGNESDVSTSDNEVIDESELTVKQTYSLLYKIMKLPSFQLFAIILLTFKVGFSAPEAVSGLKLIEAGLSKENAALLAVPMVPLQIFLPWIISRIICGPRPLDILIRAYPIRLLFGFIFPLVVYITPSFKLPDGSFPVYYYLMLIVVYGSHQVTVYCIYVSLMAYHAAISDPKIGGTYMTLLNTVTNLGGNWPSTLSLWLVDKLIIQECDQVCKEPVAINSTSIPTNSSIPVCEKVCKTMSDGYYPECLICVVLGFVWLKWGGGKLRKLQELPPSAWMVSLGSKKH